MRILQFTLEDLSINNQQSRINNMLSDAGSLRPQCPGIIAVLMSLPRFSMERRTCCNRESGASPVM